MKFISEDFSDFAEFRLLGEAFAALEEALETNGVKRLKGEYGIYNGAYIIEGFDGGIGWQTFVITNAMGNIQRLCVPLSHIAFLTFSAVPKEIRKKMRSDQS